MVKRLNPFATLSTFVVVVALAVAWASRGRQKPAGAMVQREQASAFSALPFSASITITRPTGGVYHGKMYAGTMATRTDVQMEPGKTASVIVRYDRNVTWVLMPAAHYLESPISNDDELFNLLREHSRKIQRQDLGAEWAGAYPCEKYRIEATTQNGQKAAYIWVAKAAALHGFIVKAQRGNPSETITFSDIRLGQPNPSLFEIPAGYHKLPNPGAQNGSH